MMPAPRTEHSFTPCGLDPHPWISHPHQFQLPYKSRRLTCYTPFPGMAATEATPLALAPSFELAMTRSRLHLPKNPQSGLPYWGWGACASEADFGVLGACGIFAFARPIAATVQW